MTALRAATPTAPAATPQSPTATPQTTPVTPKSPHPPRPQVVKRAQKLFSIAPLTPLDLCYIPRLIWNSLSEAIP